MGFLNLGFAKLAAAKGMYPQNAAIQCNFPLAFLGEYPDLQIDYPRLQVSKGNLMPVLDPVVLREAAGIMISWSPEGLEYQNRYDRLMVMLYFPEQNEAICLLNTANREVAQHFITLSPAVLSRELKVYLSFISEDKCEVSNSVYVEV